MSVRIHSIDALRGFAMMWISGAAGIITSLDNIFDANWTKFLNRQLEHAEWMGCRFYDLIMPLFLFLTGCAMVFSFDKRLRRDGKIKAYRHIFLRVLILWALGIIAAGVADGWDWYHLVFFSDVLQAIAVGYVAASFLLLLKNLRWQIAATLGLLCGYFGLLHFVPVPGHGAGVLTLDGNLAAYVDAKVMFFHDYGYTCILTSMTWTVTVMIGCFAGRYLKWPHVDGPRKFLHFLLAGIGLMATGFLLTSYDPCIKRIWTVSYTLISGGACLIFLGCFYFLFDVRKLHRWAYPLIIVGANSLFVYVVFSYGRIVDLAAVVDRGISGLEPYTSPFYPLIVSILGFSLMLIVLGSMYKRRVFIRV